MSWHRPNWRNQNEYPKPNHTSGSQWAWEFLRRNPEYEFDYQKYLSGEAKKKNRLFHSIIYESSIIREHLRDDPDNWALKSSLNELLEANQDLLDKPLEAIFIKPEPLHNETLREWFKRTDFALESWTSSTLALGVKWFKVDTIVHFPDPALADLNSLPYTERPSFSTTPKIKGRLSRYTAPSDCSETVELQRRILRTIEDEEKKQIYAEMQALDNEYRLGKKGDAELEEIVIRPDSNHELWIQFDLKKSLKKQLGLARQLFDQQKKLFEDDFGEVGTSRAARTDYQKCLRVLDAYHVGIKNGEIAEVLYPNESNDHPTYNGNKKIINHYNRALELQNGKYLQIPLSS